MDRYRDLVEDQLREAMERGDFDELPGAGRPLDLRDDSPDWWARSKVEELRRQEHLTELIRELEAKRDRIWSLPEEAAVRAAVSDLNRRIEELNPLLRDEEQLRLLDPDTAVSTWRKMERLRLT